MDSLKSWWGITTGGFNTKGFYIENSLAAGFTKSFFYCRTDPGTISSLNNLITTSDVGYDIPGGTNFQSINDYSESMGMFLRTAGASTVASFLIKNYRFASDNFLGQDPNYPTTKEYII